MATSKPPAKTRLMTALERQELIAHPPQRTQVSLRVQRDILRGLVPPPADWLPTKPTGPVRLVGSGDAK